MSYIALYRKWRPKTFEDVVGQGRIMKTLQQAVENDKVAHAYLFSGPRGTGKTSTAKIFAKALNCVHGPTSHPCNECDVCKHITSGESLDVVEIDAASNRSIEDIRQLRETVKFMPTEGHKKIYDRSVQCLAEDVGRTAGTCGLYLGDDRTGTNTYDHSFSLSEI